MNFLRGRLVPGAVQVGSVRLPLDFYPFRTPPTPDKDVVLGIRPEHVVLSRHESSSCTIQAEALFMEPMGADTLGWFQFGDQRLSARLAPQVARNISGPVRLYLLSEHVSLFDPTTEARL